MSIDNLEERIAIALPRIIQSFPGWKNIEIDEGNNLNKVMDDCDRMVSAMVNNEKVVFGVEIKTALSRIHDSIINDTKKFMNNNCVIATNYLTEKAAQKLRENNICYLDTAGNAYINFPGIYIFQKSDNEPIVNVLPKKTFGDLFNPSSTKIVFHVLSTPQVETASYRALASIAGVGVASAKRTIDTLKEQHFIIDAGKHGISLHHKKQLLDKWVESYNYNLRRKVYFGHYKYATNNTAITLNDTEGCWGGDVAADKITNKIESDEQLIYLHANEQEFIVKNRLIPDPKGKITLYKSSWELNAQFGEQLAPILVIYADLLWSKDPRSAEIAKHIYTEYIEGILNEK